MLDSTVLSGARRHLPSFAVLRSFEAAARYESFTLAAEELCLTQSAISRQIKDLEAVVGIELFHRVGRRVKLTEAGSNFAQELAEDLERIRQTVFRAIAAGEQGTALRIATLPTFASRWLIPRLPLFEREYPDIQVSLTTRVDKFDLSKEHIDAALHYGGANWPDANITELCAESMIAVASPEFKEKHDLSTEEALAACPLIHLETRPTQWNDWFEEAGIEGLSKLHGKQFGQFSMIISGAIAGLGAALLPSYLIENELSEGHLVIVSDVKLTTENKYYVVTPKGAQSEAVQCFVDWIHELVPSRPLHEYFE